MKNAQRIRPDGLSSSHVLPTGQLELRLHSGGQQFSNLCDIGARHNTKRGFIFISRVIGRYTAIRPSALRNISTRLAEKVTCHIQAPTLIIGMAEAAVGLAHCVHQQLSQSHLNEHLYFTHTSRYYLEDTPYIGFQEPHSHAPKQYLYKPNAAAELEAWNKVTNIIVVDDETTTGRTFFNLCSALHQELPQLEKAHHLVIHDWSKGCSYPEIDGLEFEFHSLTEGSYSFTPRPLALPETPLRSAVGNDKDKSAFFKKNYGRQLLGETCSENSWALPKLPQPRGKVLCLGSSEFQYPPFLWAEDLERRGYDVYFQSTTRSPLLQSHGIQRVLQFTDNYNDSIDNFLYNTELDDFDEVYFCSETPVELAPATLLRRANVNFINFSELER